MTLNEAIKHAEEKAKELAEEAWEAELQERSDVLKCRKCAVEHKQLAEWLKELKDYKERQGDDLK